jgi:hypothetical protein
MIEVGHKIKQRLRSIRDDFFITILPISCSCYEGNKLPMLSPLTIYSPENRSSLGIIFMLNEALYNKNARIRPFDYNHYITRRNFR